MKGKPILLIICLILAGCINGTGNEDGDTTTDPRGLISESDLEYLGAFRLPDGPSDTESWAWGGTALTYYPEGDRGGPDDGFPGSLYGAGHAWEHRVSEISIPVPVISAGKNPDDLNRAVTIQGFRDVLDVSRREIPRTGLQYLPPQGNESGGKLYYCTGEHMQEWEKGATHGMMNLDLSSPDRKGLWKVGDLVNYVTNDYMFEIPAGWADRFAGGNNLGTGRFRDGGQGAMGPSLIAVGIRENGSVPSSGSVLSAKPLILYGNAYMENPKTVDEYHHSDEWSGGLWLTAGEKEAVIFIGTKGTGDCWYGFSNGVVWEEPYPPVPAYPHDDRGWWSSGFSAVFLFYDPDDLRAVAEGGMESGDPQPYEMADMGPFLFNDDFRTHVTESGVVQVQRKYRFGGCAFDRENRIVYVMELFADEDKPIVHAWKLE